MTDPTPASHHAERALDGIKVLDVGTYIAGPAAATVMSDFGADVIKVEAPGGDPYRELRRQPGYPESEHNFAWLADSRNKRSIVLDLAQDAARDILYRLVREADVFVTNFPLPVRERLGIRHEDLGPLNERLIYASLTAYGEAGPEATRTGFDSTAWWARSGLMDLVKPAPDAAPARSIPGMGDHPTALALYGAILTALYQRERTGKGAHVTSSLMGCGAWSNAIYVQAALAGAEIPRRPPREESPNALTNIYRCRDGHWFLLAGVNEERVWNRLCRAAEREELLDDPRFRTMAGRHANAGELFGVLDQLFLGRDWPEWLELMQTAGITFGVVNRVEEVRDDPQMRAAGVLVPFEDGPDEIALTVDTPLWIRDQAKVPPRMAPEVGEHTDEVLAELGCDPDTIRRLRAEGSVG
ncbi:MAG: CoA transferase [Alphaproteobacteria bacterium]|jgi:formyl-CoA transferase|nr:CoA transferase [Alphaproteobacteria bacterium]